MRNYVVMKFYYILIALFLCACGSQISVDLPDSADTGHSSSLTNASILITANKTKVALLGNIVVMLDITIMNNGSLDLFYLAKPNFYSNSRDVEINLVSSTCGLLLRVNSACSYRLAVNDPVEDNGSNIYNIVGYKTAKGDTVYSNLLSLPFVSVVYDKLLIKVSSTNSNFRTEIGRTSIQRIRIDNNSYMGIKLSFAPKDISGNFLYFSNINNTCGNELAASKTCSFVFGVTGYSIGKFSFGILVNAVGINNQSITTSSKYNMTVNIINEKTFKDAVDNNILLFPSDGFSILTVKVSNYGMPVRNIKPVIINHNDSIHIIETDDTCDTLYLSQECSYKLRVSSSKILDSSFILTTSAIGVDGENISTKGQSIKVSSYSLDYGNISLTALENPIIRNIGSPVVMTVNVDNKGATDLTNITPYAVLPDTSYSTAHITNNNCNKILSAYQSCSYSISINYPFAENSFLNTYIKGDLPGVGSYESGVIKINYKIKANILNINKKFTPVKVINIGNKIYTFYHDEGGIYHIRVYNNFYKLLESVILHESLIDASYDGTKYLYILGRDNNDNVILSQYDIDKNLTDGLLWSKNIKFGGTTVLHKLYAVDSGIYIGGSSKYNPDTQQQNPHYSYLLLVYNTSGNEVSTIYHSTEYDKDDEIIDVTKNSDYLALLVRIGNHSDLHQVSYYRVEILNLVDEGVHSEYDVDVSKFNGFVPLKLLMLVHDNDITTYVLGNCYAGISNHNKHNNYSIMVHNNDIDNIYNYGNSLYNISNLATNFLFNNKMKIVVIGTVTQQDSMDGFFSIIDTTSMQKTYSDIIHILSPNQISPVDFSIGQGGIYIYGSTDRLFADQSLLGYKGVFLYGI